MEHIIGGNYLKLPYDLEPTSCFRSPKGTVKNHHSLIVLAVSSACSAKYGLVPSASDPPGLLRYVEYLMMTPGLPFGVGYKSRSALRMCPACGAMQVGAVKWAVEVDEGLPGGVVEL